MMFLGICYTLFKNQCDKLPTGHSASQVVLHRMMIVVSCVKAVCSHRACTQQLAV